MYETITENLQRIKNALPNGVTLVAVSKTKPIKDLQEAYDAGQRIFGENKVQELQEKYPALPKDIQWHMIGHLQSNKVKYIAPFISLIHGVESLKLLKEINKQALKNNRKIKVLLQFMIAEESTKFGFSLDEVQTLLISAEYRTLNNISIVGIMGMASNVNDDQQVSNEFNNLKKYFDILKINFFPQSNEFTTISMGMSGDYELAIQEGSTMVRIGSSIFGSRNYEK